MTAARTVAQSPLSAHALMTPIEAAAFLGMSRTSFNRRVINMGLIPYLRDKATGRRVYRREDLEEYANDHYEYHPARPPSMAAEPVGQTARSARRHAAKARA